jgi:N6-L-threonylcarbamoyladenine synthase
MLPVLDEACRRADAPGLRGIEAVAVTEGPGLAGSLLVGITLARTLAWLHDLPLVPVNHHAGHLAAAWLDDPDAAQPGPPALPALGLVVSGGHTFLVLMRDELDLVRLGGTVDDAAGEAFDKVGRLLGLPYPGGPAIAAAAARASRRARRLPRAWLGDSDDFSFSGLKTAVRREVASALGLPPDADPGDAPGLPPDAVAEIAWAFQDSVVDVLTVKTVRAAERTGARSIVLGGGVAANQELRTRLAARADALGIPLHVPRPSLCTDNAAMIGAAAWPRYLAGVRAGPDLDARPALRLAG